MALPSLPGRQKPRWKSHLAQDELGAREDYDPGGEAKGAAGLLAQQLPGSMQGLAASHPAVWSGSQLQGNGCPGQKAGLKVWPSAHPGGLKHCMSIGRRACWGCKHTRVFLISAGKSAHHSKGMSARVGDA